MSTLQACKCHASTVCGAEQRAAERAAHAAYYYGDASAPRPEGIATYRGVHRAAPLAEIPELASYFISGRSTGSYYIACERCATDAAKAMLTHHPRGWPRWDVDPKFDDPYGFDRYEEVKNNSQ